MSQVLWIHIQLPYILSIQLGLFQKRHMYCLHYYWILSSSYSISDGFCFTHLTAIFDASGLWPSPYLHKSCVSSVCLPMFYFELLTSSSTSSSTSTTSVLCFQIPSGFNDVHKFLLSLYRSCLKTFFFLKKEAITQ